MALDQLDFLCFSFHSQSFISPLTINAFQTLANPLSSTNSLNIIVSGPVEITIGLPDTDLERKGSLKMRLEYVWCSKSEAFPRDEKALLYTGVC